MRFEKSYIINETKNYDLVRPNIKTPYNRGDLAEVSFCEHYNDFNHNMKVKHNKASNEPDFITNGIRYQVKGLRASIKIETTIKNYIDTCACDMFSLVLKMNENQYQVYELNKNQMLDLLLNNKLVRHDISSSKNGSVKTLRLKENYKIYQDWFN